MLYARESECAQVDRLLAAAGEGRSDVLVLRGEAGIGKSAVLDYAASAAGTMRVIRGTGIESESELPFASLHLLLRPALGHAGALPAPQAKAIRGAFGLAEAGGADRFLVGVAVLGLLTELAAKTPLLCLVDDAHWLDAASAEALTFAGRRLDAEGVVMIFAARDDAHGFPAQGLPEVWLSGLDRNASAALLARYQLTPATRDRIIEEAGGNPLALLELAAALSSAHRDTRPGPLVLHVGASTPPGQVQEAFTRQIQRLPLGAQTLLLVAAADDRGDLGVVLRAAASLGVGLPDLGPAERVRLIRTDDGRVVFRHPLVRAAAYQSATAADRLAVHRALAAVLDGEADADRRAWHLAAAATQPDESIASELEHSAERARRRGGYIAVAAAYQRAAELTPAGPCRAARLAAAARAAADAGQLERADVLAASASAESDDPVTLAGVAHVRARVEFERGSARVASRIYLEAAALARGQSSAMAIQLLVEAGLAAWRYVGDPSVLQDAVAQLPPDAPAGSPLAPFVRALRAFARLQAGDLADALPTLRAAVDELRRTELDVPGMLAAGLMCMSAAEYTALEALAGVAATRCRQRGMIGPLIMALRMLSVAMMAGRARYAEAAVSLEEALRLAVDARQPHAVSQITCSLALLSAVTGDEDRCRQQVEQSIAASAGHDDSLVAAIASWASGLMNLGLARYPDALACLESVPPQGNPFVVQCSIDLVEAAARAGQPERAGPALARIDEWAAYSSDRWMRAAALRSRALLSPRAEAGEHFAAAVELLRDADQPYERGRTHLLYGEWLRRGRHPTEARPHLRTAAELLERVGAAPWTERARTELRAAGETPTGRDARRAPLDRLTAQERQVVRRAAEGASNRQIAAELFLSHRTVGYHLYKAFPKLGIASRAELAKLAVEM